MAHQRGVDDGDPPHRLTDHRQRSPPVPDPHAGQPFGRVGHRGDGPVECARLDRRVAHLLAVPCHPAADTAEPGVLAARREHGAALLAVPGIRHRAMLSENAPEGREYGADLTLWGPGVRPDPFPAQPGCAMLRVTFELGKEAGNV